MAARGSRLLGFGLVLALATMLTLATRDTGFAAVSSDVRKTKHNLSASGPGAVRATSESQVCVFCHTPHAATPGLAPLWNRARGASTYTPYTSSSLDANAIQGALDQPGGSSKLCLSCHDGTVAIGSVNVLNGVGSDTKQGTVSIGMAGTAAGGVMPGGAGATTGFTRNLGTDLGNDHPISVSYTNALALRDGELRVVDANQRYPAGTGTLIGIRNSGGGRPTLPLEPVGAGGTGQVQCATCHDPHRHDDDASKGPQKFLRQNRFQEAHPTAVATPATDIICLSCHDKNMAVGTWAYSAHANPLVATQTYTATASAQREFPANIPVWKASCLNCHDAHTVQGARRLAREGTDSPLTPKAGGGSAIEETCYQCHSSAAQSIVTPSATVPDIKSDFELARRMPIKSTDQPGSAEKHDIAGNFADTFIDCTGPTNGCGKDFIEPRTTLGAGNLNNRHAECTDCHNPHRVVKFQDFRGNGGSLAGTPDARGSHKHTETTGYTHSNVISGVLRGSWGVEPAYGSASFHAMPTSYQVKRGDPGASTDTSATASFVTREYQICLKCHSDYGYTDNNVYPVGTRPNLGSSGGGTPAGTNNLTQYTNQAKEFQAPAGHMGQASTTDGGAGAVVGWQTNNHRSWHPVIGPTGRTGSVRGNGTDISARWRSPWSNAVGSQTMYCSDCHGTDTGALSVIPASGKPWGPHGSGNNFILKGTWTGTTGTGNQSDGLCFKCHVYANYATASGARTGFYNDPNDKGRGDLHQYHAEKIGRMRCGWCHVAVPHGWKNKAFLVNLNDVGPEAGVAAGTQVRNNTRTAYNQGPYYNNALLKIRSFGRSGLWRENNCGSSGAPGNGQSGRNWMRDSSESCTNPP